MRCCAECDYWSKEMTPYTDANIPVECGECSTVCEGFGDILGHILEAHGTTYDQADAVKYAQLWVEDAYPEREKELADYYRERQIEKAIDADTFPFK